MTHVIRRLRNPAIAVLILVGFVAAGAAQHASVANAGMAASVQIMNGSAGQYLADANGMTLYVFSADQANSGTSACTGGCVTPWPPATVSDSAMAPSGLMGVLGTITRDDGSSQLIYNGMPLYRFARDTAPGQTNGQGITAFGGTWTLATP